MEPGSADAKMITREQILKIIADNERPLRGLGVKSLSLFGSAARNEATEKSDVDFLVEFDRPIGLFHLIRVQQYLEDLLGVEKVDLVTRNALREEFKDEVLKEAIRAT